MSIIPNGTLSKEDYINEVLDRFETSLFFERKTANTDFAQNWHKTWRTKLAGYLNERVGFRLIEHRRLSEEEQYTYNLTDVFMFMYDVFNPKTQKKEVEFIAIRSHRDDKTIHFATDKTNPDSVLIRCLKDPDAMPGLPLEVKKRTITFAEFYKCKRKMAKRAEHDFERCFVQFFKDNLQGTEDKKLRNILAPILGGKARQLLFDGRKEFEAVIFNRDCEYLDVDLWNACRKLGDDSDVRMAIPVEFLFSDIYNFLTQFPKGAQRETVISQLPVMAEICKTFEDMFLTKDVWSLIAQGGSPYEAVGSYFGVSAATIKQCIKKYARKSEIIPKGKSSHFSQVITWQEILPALDMINPNLWPRPLYEKGSLKSVWHSTQMVMRDNASFMACLDAAKIYADHFYSDDKAPEVLRHWVKQFWKDVDGIWFGLAKKILSDEWKESIELSEKFFGPMLNKYKYKLHHIKDMKRDLETKLIRYLVDRAAYQMDVRLDEAQRNTVMESVVSSLWNNSLPSEQMSASAYWHAPNARFAEKFQTLIGGETVEWGALTGDAVTDLPDGFSAHCLNDEKLLLEETLEMDHCVWSYTRNCLENGFHIFSVRDKAGVRASTLTIKAELDGSGSVTYKNIANLSVKNDPPSQQAYDAAAELVRRLNEGEIKPDWDAISRQRALAQRVFGNKKMDPMNDEMMQSVLNLYKSCFPKAVRRGGFTPDELIKTLDIREAIGAAVTPSVPGFPSVVARIFGSGPKPPRMG